MAIQLTQKEAEEILKDNGYKIEVREVKVNVTNPWTSNYYETKKRLCAVKCNLVNYNIVELAENILKTKLLKQ